MNTLVRAGLFVSALTAGACSGRWKCYTPTDNTVGWKKVVIPAGVPALSAPSDVEQFRGGELSIVWSAMRSAPSEVFENEEFTHFYFRLSGEVTDLQVNFNRDLDGARVEIHGTNESGHSMTIAPETRLRGYILTATWNAPSMIAIDVVVHHHLRVAPIARAWREGERKYIALEPWVDDAFRGQGVLYYLNRGGREISLCNNEDFVPSVERWSVQGEVAATTLTPGVVARVSETVSRW